MYPIFLSSIKQLTMRGDYVMRQITDRLHQILIFETSTPVLKPYS